VNNGARTIQVEVWTFDLKTLEYIYIFLYSTFIFIFKILRSAKLLSKAPELFVFSPETYEGSNLSLSLPTFVITWFF
jgi:hypothetical protein